MPFVLKSSCGISKKFWVLELDSPGTECNVQTTVGVSSDSTPLVSYAVNTNICYLCDKKDPPCSRRAKRNPNMQWTDCDGQCGRWLDIDCLPRPVDPSHYVCCNCS